MGNYIHIKVNTNYLFLKIALVFWEIWLELDKFWKTSHLWHFDMDIITNFYYKFLSQEQFIRCKWYIVEKQNKNSGTPCNVDELFCCFFCHISGYIQPVHASIHRILGCTATPPPTTPTPMSGFYLIPELAYLFCLASSLCSWICSLFYLYMWMYVCMYVCVILVLF